MRISLKNIKTVAVYAAFALAVWGCGHSTVVVGRRAETKGITPQEQSQPSGTAKAAKSAGNAGQKTGRKQQQSVLKGANGGMMGMGGFKRPSGAKAEASNAKVAANMQPKSSPAKPRPAPPKEEEVKSKSGPAPYKLDLSFGGFGLGIGLFDTPVGIAVDGQENMYVVDQGNYRIQKFDRFGLFQFAFGRQGMGNGEFAQSMTTPVALRETGEFEFNKPAGIYLDQDRTRNIVRLHVVDSLNNRIQRFLVASNVSDFMNSYNPFDASPPNVFVMLTKTGDVVDTALHDKFLAENRLVILDPLYLQDIAGKANAFLLTPFIWGGLGFTQGQLNQPTYLTMDENKVLWVSDTGNGRVEGFNVSESNPAVDATYYREFGNDVNASYGKGRLNQPTAIAYDNQGLGGFLVLDKLPDGTYAIEKFDRDGRFTGIFTKSGDKEGQLKEPVDIAVDPFDNTCFVTDRGRRKIMVYNNKGEFMYEFGGDELADPRGIAVLRNGYVYVTDAAKNMVYRYVPQ